MGASFSLRKRQGLDVPAFPPIYAVEPPGNCLFNEEWTPVPLIAKVALSPDVRIFTFELPDPDMPLGLSTCASILARGGADADGNMVVRPYTPVSTNAMLGQFEILVKIYPDGRLTQFMESMAIGDFIEFKHIPFNVKVQYPFHRKRIGMIVAGTGINPMIQALHALLGNVEDETNIVMLYGNKTEEDILGHAIIEEWVSNFQNRFKVVHFLSREPPKSPWRGHRRRMCRNDIVRYMPPPEEDPYIFVCGPAGMYADFCGPRGDKELSGHLKDIGYQPGQVYKF